MSEEAKNLEIEEALGRLLDRISPITETLDVYLENADGMICARDIYAKAPVPAFPRSAMDGYKRELERK